MKLSFIIQARTGSTRFKNKVILDFYERDNILDIIIKKLKKINVDCKIIIATTELNEDNCIEKIASKHSVHCFRGDVDNVLLRFIRTAEMFAVEGIVRICGDNPFIDIGLLTQLLQRYNNSYDYLSFKMYDNLPVIKSHLGLFAEITNIHALKKIYNRTKEKTYLEHVTNYIYSNPTSFNVQLLPLSTFLNKRKDLRFTIDTKKDFLLMKELFKKHKESNNDSFRDLIQICDSDITLLNSMKKNISKNEK